MKVPGTNVEVEDDGRLVGDAASLRKLGMLLTHAYGRGEQGCMRILPPAHPVTTARLLAFQAAEQAIPHPEEDYRKYGRARDRLVADFGDVFAAIFDGVAANLTLTWPRDSGHSLAIKGADGSVTYWQESRLCDGYSIQFDDLEDAVVVSDE